MSGNQENAFTISGISIFDANDRPYNAHLEVTTGPDKDNSDQLILSFHSGLETLPPPISDRTFSLGSAVLAAAVSLVEQPGNDGESITDPDNGIKITKLRSPSYMPNQVEVEIMAPDPDDIDNPNKKYVFGINGGTLSSLQAWTERGNR